ncbi:MAG: bifunctional riboflavin kinase/FAD synthetase [Dehalococcoidia bacterium]|nr:bifunctional riboflavin kinase/FAD synthetase [Dehalococcoidia bacterium]
MSESVSPVEELSAVRVERETALTVGVFDGVHRGHLHVLNTLKRRAAERGFASGVITLHPHPALVLNPSTPIVYLTTIEERVELLRASGVDFVVPLTFTLDLARFSAREFVTLLVEKLRMRFLLIGPDFALGRGREGGPALLSQLASEMNFELEKVGPFVEKGQVISSSTVRVALQEGDLETVAHLLGRPFSLHGPVVHGVERGKVMGFPTANIGVGSGMALPPFGVYVTRAHIGAATYDSVTNIGRRPTFDNGERTVEVYIMDFDGDLYGAEVRIDVLKRLRGEVRFASVDELAEQIRRDVADARGYLASHR